MTDKPESLNFQLEAHCKNVPVEVIELATMLKDNPNASITERQLAWLLLKLAYAHNELVSTLETGSVCLTVFERDINRQ